SLRGFLVKSHITSTLESWNITTHTFSLLVTKRCRANSLAAAMRLPAMEADASSRSTTGLDFFCRVYQNLRCSGFKGPLAVPFAIMVSATASWVTRSPRAFGRAYPLDLALPALSTVAVRSGAGMLVAGSDHSRRLR